MAILSKACKPDNFESHNSLKLSFANIRGLCSNFVACKFFLESNSPWHSCSAWDKPGWLNWFLCEMWDLLLIQKASSTHMHGLAVYMKEGVPFAQDVSLETSSGSYYCFWLALLHSVSYFSFLYRSPSWSLCKVFDCFI